MDWSRQRHAFAGDLYSFSFAVHRLRDAGAGKLLWSMMVVTEHWWDPEKNAIKATTWARRLEGSIGPIRK